ncbi:MAG TPA: GNAT family N-acetyltransferase [Gemmatimonadales bacterium]|nr:GNAT family N-acetyltransferase [Gemmatimonadales bacterium]
MEAIRTFRRDDIPQVAELFATTFMHNGTSASSGLDRYFERVFFESPLDEEDLPSFVYLDASGSIAGFIGVQPRRLRLRGRRLRAAVATKLMVAPRARGSFAAVRLVSRVFAGPQDVLFSDLSNEAARAIFEGFGGVTVLPLSLQWQRPVRPARHSLSWLHARGVPGVITHGLRPLGSLADAVVARLSTRRFRDLFAGYAVEDLPVDLLAQRFDELCSDRALRPEYDERSLHWLLNVAEQNQPDRVLRRRVVRDARGEVVGWFLYYLAPGGESEVVQLVARKGAGEAVFHALLDDAWRGGTVMLTGRLEPRLVREMSALHCYFRQGGHWTLAHAKQPDVLEAILSGNAFLSRLEGEW